MPFPSSDGPTLSLVIPCYNEQMVLHTLRERLSTVCDKLQHETVEIILINDGSKDTTWPLIQEWARQDKRVTAINLSRNYGHQIALTAGLTYAQGVRILILDADLQDPPELLPAMLDLMESEKADVVYGQRQTRQGERFFKCMSARLFYRLIDALSDTPLPANVGDFRLISRRVADHLSAMPEQARYIRGMTSWVGFKQVPFPYERQPRHAGETKYPLRKMLHFAADAITGFSVIPLRVASYLGALFGVIGLFLLIYVLGSWLMGETVQGWTSLMVVVLVIGSVQLLCLGVFGEYLGRLYMESKRRPLYLIDEVVTCADVSS
ncbi:MAG: glycosyltransferase [Proteobacteria bacterium]|nr:glycosyltransferase [Pseudomonadota bacterium]